MSEKSIADTNAPKKKGAPRRALGKAGGGLKRGIKKVKGPSPNPATNLLIADLTMRSAMILFRRGLERNLLRARFDENTAREIIEGRPYLRSIAMSAVARQATKTVPGMLLLGGGLLAKVAFDRGRNRQKVRREGMKKLHEMAKNGKKQED